MSGEDQRFAVAQQSWANDIKELAVQKYAADNYRRLLDESDHAYEEMHQRIAALEAALGVARAELHVVYLGHSREKYPAALERINTTLGEQACTRTA